MLVGLSEYAAATVFPRREITEMKKPRKKKKKNQTENYFPKMGDQGANVRICINALFLRQ